MKPPIRNPFALTRTPLLPPHGRSRATLGITAAAATGRFALQRCGACGAVQYPARDVCGACLSDDLRWRDVSAGGTVIAETTVRISADPYFREHVPWRVGTVALDCGPSVVAHLHGTVVRGDRVRMAQKLDKSGEGVMVALPEAAGPGTGQEGDDDRQMREMTCDPRDRRVLVTDVRNTFGQAVARALADAGARVTGGVAEVWKPFDGGEGFPGDIIDLDVTDTESVRRAAAAYGGRVEILVNTALHIRPGGILARGDVTTAREEVEVAYFGALRLAQSFGPALRARGADGTHPACAWVNILSAEALAPGPGFAASGAAHAGALALSQALRGELRSGGIRVIDALVGPLDDAWHLAVPPPKVTPAALAGAIVRALRDGVEHVAVGDVAQDIFTRWCDDPMVLRHERISG